MVVHDPSSDGQPQAGTAGLACPGLIGPVETVKNTRDVLRGNPDAAVLHLDFDFVIFFLYFKLDLSPGGGILDAVVHEDTDGLFNQLLVRLKIGGTVQFCFKSVGRVNEAGFADNLLHHFAHVKDGFFQMYSLTVPPGEEKKLFNQGFHILCFALDGVDRFLHRLFIMFTPAIQEVGITLDHRDGGAQFMGGVGDETDLRLVGLADPVEQAIDGISQVLQFFL